MAPALAGATRYETSRPELQLIHRIILDCDPGVDDAIAILLALAGGDRIRLEAITTVGGNVPLALTTANAIRICDLAKRWDIPVYAGADAPIARPVSPTDNVHGMDGLGDVGLPEASRGPEAENAVDAIQRIVASYPGEVTVCVTGPMTNLATALLLRPALSSQIKDVVFMGGALHHPGNTTPVAEYNIWYDAHAADLVFRSGIPLTMLGLDVTSKAVLTPQRIDALANIGPTGRLSSQMLTAYAQGDVCLHDPCVIAYLLQPELFAGERHKLAAVYSDGPNYGRTMSLPQGDPNALILTSVDPDGLFTLLGNAIQRLTVKDPDMRLKAYLAGPDVFLKNAKEVLLKKSQLAASEGFTPIIPGDLDVSAAGSRIGWGVAISQLDEKMMRESDLIIANLTPFRGISADAGTVYELAFMAASGKPVFGYSNSARTYLERNIDFYEGKVSRLSEERWAAPDDTNIENFDMGENLMVEGGILSRGGVFVREEVNPAAIWSDLTSFVKCVAAARDRLLVRNHEGSV